MVVWNHCYVSLPEGTTPLYICTLYQDGILAQSAMACIAGEGEAP